MKKVIGMVEIVGLNKVMKEVSDVEKCEELVNMWWDEMVNRSYSKWGINEEFDLYVGNRMIYGVLIDEENFEVLFYMDDNGEVIERSLELIEK